MNDIKPRCGWVKLNDPVYVAYHDEEWGRALHDDHAIFELFSLETQAAGLSWLTVLKKRDAYREAFKGFELEKVAAYTNKDIDCMINGSIVIKNRPKLEAVVNNAQIFVNIKKDYGSLAAYF